MTRRELLAAACAWTAGARALAQHPGAPHVSAAAIDPQGDADITLRIAETTVDIGPRRSVRTLAYNSQVPGPLLRARRDQRLTVDVWNDAADEDIVHWHGLHVAPEVDGAFEEGTPGVPPKGGRRRYAFTAAPGGTRW